MPGEFQGTHHADQVAQTEAGDQMEVAAGVYVLCSRFCFAGLFAGLLYAIQGPVDILVILALLQKAHIPRPAQEKPDFDFYQNSDGDDASEDSDSEDENGNPDKGLDPETRRQIREMSANLHKQVCERL
jgi:hypothetical protein